MKSLRVTEILAQKYLDVYRNTYPHSRLITPESYPEQDESMVGEIIELKIRDEYELDYNEIRKTPSDGRPGDDVPWTEPIDGPDDYENPDYFELPCEILRFDAGEPHVLIACTLDYDYILIGDTRTYEDEVLIYPHQYINMIGFPCHNRYNFIDEPVVSGFIIRQDAKDPSDGVAVEIIGEEKRYVLESECESVLLELPDWYDYVNKETDSDEIEDIREKRKRVIEYEPNEEEEEE